MLGLGIDTGGTYTDAVIYDFERGKVAAWAKSLTTRFDLGEGVRDALDRLPQDGLSRVGQIALSTTLATNACVEGKGARAVLLLFGYDVELLHRLGPEYGLAPSPEIIILPGRHTQEGGEDEPPDWGGLRRLAGVWRERAEAFAVAEYWGVRNPDYEKRARDLIASETGLPVVCAHELSGRLNSLRRAAGALLNARLIPLASDLYAAVRRTLAERGVTAPLSVVGGDGGLMSAEFARLHPIQTLLSGPAASVLGAAAMVGAKDGVVVDMGGTTTDAAVVLSGRAAQAPDGAEVGGWRTGTRALAVQTNALGGDGMLNCSRGRLAVGPERAVPLAYLGWAHPDLVPALERAGKEEEIIYLLSGSARRPPDLNHDENRMLELLRGGPLSLAETAASLGTFPTLLPLRRLVELGLVMRSALTPTDLLHATGEFAPWSREAALAGMRVFAAEHGLSPDDLPGLVEAAVDERLFALILEAAAAAESPPRRLTQAEQKLLREGLRPTLSNLSVHPKLNLPLIGLGAPIAHYLPKVARALGSQAVIPQEAAVANAVGAVAGWVSAEEEITVLPAEKGFSLHSSALQQSFSSYADALEFARRHGEELVRSALRARGGRTVVEIESDLSEEKGEAGGSAPATILLGAHIRCRGRAEPEKK